MQSFRLSAWWTAGAIVTLLPFATYPFVQLDTIPTNLLTISHTGVKRALWIGAISWIIFATVSCSKKSKENDSEKFFLTDLDKLFSGLVAQFLSAKFWQPLSRLTFSIYLVQSLVVWYYAYQGRSLHWISHYNAVITVLSFNTNLNYVFLDFSHWRRGTFLHSLRHPLVRPL